MAAQADTNEKAQKPAFDSDNSDKPSKKSKKRQEETKTKKKCSQNGTRRRR